MHSSLFVSDKHYDADPGELRYDMFNAEFTYEGDNCSFETFLKRLGSTDPALHAIAEIVHDIDLKDQKISRPEKSGIAHVIAGISLSQHTDEDRLARGTAIFNDIYERFRRGSREQPK
jgi:hypothetical protein